MRVSCLHIRNICGLFGSYKPLYQSAPFSGTAKTRTYHTVQRGQDRSHLGPLGPLERQCRMFLKRRKAVGRNEVVETLATALIELDYDAEDETCVVLAMERRHA